MPRHAARTKVTGTPSRSRASSSCTGPGTLRYAGSTPQGMAVYEYGDGGMSCLHSTLHPVGVERSPVECHPETLFVILRP